jgi:hypothetical protein
MRQLFLFMLLMAQLYPGKSFSSVEDKGVTVNREKRAIEQISSVLKINKHPENIDKIAILYVASAVAGPVGSAISNVVYDKLVLKRKTIGIWKSYALGAAVGYAVDSAESKVVGSEYVNEITYLNYLEKSVVGIGDNLDSTAGEVMINSGKYKLATFLATLEKGVEYLTYGNEFFEYLDVGKDGKSQKEVDAAAVRLVEAHLRGIDFEKVIAKIKSGFINGVDLEFMKDAIEPLINSISQETRQLSPQGIEEFSAILFSLLKSAEATNYIAGYELMFDRMNMLSVELRTNLRNRLKTSSLEIKEVLAHEFYKKRFDQLSNSEQLASGFNFAYRKAMLVILNNEARLNPAIANLVRANEFQGNRSPAGLKEIALSIFGFATAVDVATDISSMVFELSLKENAHALINGDKQQKAIHSARERLDSLGKLYTHKVVGQSAVDVYVKTWEMVADGPDTFFGTIDGLSKKSMFEILKLVKNTGERFKEEHDELKSRDDVFRAAAADIYESAFPPPPPPKQKPQLQQTPQPSKKPGGDDWRDHHPKPEPLHKPETKPEPMRKPETKPEPMRKPETKPEPIIRYKIPLA